MDGMVKVTPPEATTSHDLQGTLSAKIITLKKAARTERPRAVPANVSYAKMTAGPRKDPPKNFLNDTSTENIKVLLSVITSVDIGELVLLAKKFKGAASPVEKIIVLVEHASLVETIKNNKI
ncbi:hypothetical protein EVAR_92074_1 [Eumeta japonica]|uniref:Nucleic-acid-binding protein from transposon X-element n=1 Tax=Eumeta variegata TaxID=151549 RepID=A0A4C1T140_EUMVA|nr:hypothetical protein EVAR_92074_1 [Eumeta japonica]